MHSPVMNRLCMRLRFRLLPRYIDAETFLATCLDTLNRFLRDCAVTTITSKYGMFNLTHNNAVTY